jgi:diaminohydroxyphosphoribosylaminopyrimidine deaminase/5-amino-6-(5-phosphoribosylamino)uracil reductase
VTKNKTDAEDQTRMRECLALAARGAGHVSPNPLVGCVIVRDGEVIGKGFHRKFGGAHAEVNAIKNAGRDVKGSTVFVNLEPCSITAKTPPCADLLISSGISRVVAGMIDPNPAIAGRGVERLRKAGIRVDVGVLQDECSRLNETFTKFMTKKAPFVTLKIAQTLDGMIADSTGSSQWISGALSRKAVHQMRSHYDAVLVGAGTIRRDNPSLTVRNVRGRNPARVIIAPTLNIPQQANVFRNSLDEKVFIFTNAAYDEERQKKIKLFSARGVQIIAVGRTSTGALSLDDVLHALAERGIASVLVEGGAATFSAFLEQGAADKVTIFTAPKILGPGLGVFSRMSKRALETASSLSSIETSRLGDDLVIEGYLRNAPAISN